MPRTNWAEKIKDNLVSAVCTALVGMVLAGASMLIYHDKKIDRIEDKVNIVLIKVAPEAAAGFGLATINEPLKPAPVLPPHEYAVPPSQDEQHLATH